MKPDRTEGWPSVFFLADAYLNNLARRIDAVATDRFASAFTSSLKSTPSFTLYDKIQDLL